MYGIQFFSSVGGMRSGLVSTPVKWSLSFVTVQRCPYQHTNRPLATRVIFLGQPVCTLVDKVGCVAPLDGRDLNIKMGHTFTCNREQDDATGFLYVGYSQFPYEVHLSVLTPDEETYLEYWGPAKKHQEVGVRTNLVDQRS